MSWTPTRTAHGMFEFKHKTGLTLLLHPKDGLEVTTANITYHVGSRNEGLGVRGATHYLEHGMFKGSKNFNKEKGNGMWALESMGAYMNATTYTDRTNYFSVIDSDKLNEVIMREADRMKEPLLDATELKNEMTVVRNEFERGENNDFEILQKRIMAMAFMAHPYHHSTIGWRSEIENVSREALKTFHDTFYKPTNATYTFCGNFDCKKVMDMVDEEFSSRYDDNYNKEIPDMYTTEPVQMGQRRTVITRPTNCALMCVSFKAPNGLHKDAIVLEVIANIISKGPQSMSEKYKRDASCPVHDIIVDWERMRDPYLFSIWGTTNFPSKDALQKAENVIKEITHTIGSKNLQEDIKRAKIYISNKWNNEMMGTRKMASAINEAIARGDAFDVFNRFNVLDKVNYCDVLRVAKDIFNYDRSTVGWLLPGEIPKEVKSGTYNAIHTQSFELEDLPEAAKPTLNVSPDEWSYYTSDKTDIRLSLQTNDLSVKGYVTRSILSDLMVKGFRMSKRDCIENELYEFLSERNIQRQVTTGVDAIHIMASVPNEEKTLKSAVSLINHEISKPIMNENAFKYLKGKWLAELRGNKTNVNAVAKYTFAQSLFKSSDPNYKYSFDTIMSTVQKVNYSDIKALQKSLSSSTRLVTIVSPYEVNGLENKESYKRDYKNDIRETALSKDVRIPGKSSVVVKYGMVIPEYSDALHLAVACLGNGFTARLMKIVRDKYGLTYGINSRLKHGKGCAIFEITGTFSPKLLKRGIEETNKVIKDWLKDSLDANEISVQQMEMVGSRNVQFDAPGALASAIHQNKIIYGNVDRIDFHKFKETICAITPDQVNEAKRQITFDKLALIRVGTF